MKYNHFTLLVSATTLISALFVTACNDGVTIEKGANSSYAVSEYELSNGAAEYIDETRMAVLSLEHPDTQAGQYDLEESGKDCFFIKPSQPTSLPPWVALTPSDAWSTRRPQVEPVMPWSSTWRVRAAPERGPTRGGSGVGGCGAGQTVNGLSQRQLQEPGGW